MSECFTQLYLAHCQHLRAQEQKHLAKANRPIAELMVQIVRQRVIVEYALDTGQRSAMAESLLMRSKEAFAYSRSTGCFCSAAASNVRVSGSSKRPDPPSLRATARGWRGGLRMGGGWRGRRK